MQLRDLSDVNSIELPLKRLKLLIKPAMKAYIITLILFYNYTQAKAQTGARVEITLENTTYINVEKRMFFEQPTPSSLHRPTDDLLSIQLNKGQNLPNSERLNVEKIDDYHYVLNSLSEKPEIVYFNYRLLYISPGDDIKLTFKASTQPMDPIFDEIIASGINSGNYNYTNFLNRKKLLDDYYPSFESQKYKANRTLFFQDLNKFYKFQSEYFDSLFTSMNCSRELIEYLQREYNYGLYFDLFLFETQLLNQQSPQLPAFSVLIEDSFRKIKFVSADTAQNFIMENLFKAYFKHLITVKFKQPNTKLQFDKLLNYIQEYPDLLVQEYLTYFLIANYHSTLDKYYSDDKVKNMIVAMKNQNVRQALNIYSR